MMLKIQVVHTQPLFDVASSTSHWHEQQLASVKGIEGSQASQVEGDQKIILGPNHSHPFKSQISCVEKNETSVKLNRKLLLPMKDQDQSTEAATSNPEELGRKKPTRVLLVTINIYIYFFFFFGNSRGGKRTYYIDLTNRN